MVEIFPPGSVGARKLEEQLERDNKVRGKFLVLAIDIEFMVGWIVCEHFCPEEERKRLMFSLVIGWPEAFPFSSRITLLDRLLELRYSDLKLKYSGLKEKLDKIRKFRNRLAHASPDIAIFPDKIRLKWYDDDGTEKQQDVTHSEVAEREKECREVFGQLVEIQLEIKKRNE